MHLGAGRWAVKSETGWEGHRGNLFSPQQLRASALIGAYSESLFVWRGVERAGSVECLGGERGGHLRESTPREAGRSRENFLELSRDELH